MTYRARTLVLGCSVAILLLAAPRKALAAECLELYKELATLCDSEQDEDRCHLNAAIATCNCLRIQCVD